MDKLLCNRLYENGDVRHRRTFAYKITCNHLETMESAKQEAVGITETRNRQRPCESDGIRWRPLSVDSDKDVRSQSYLEREAVPSWARQLLRLLHGTTCFEVMLNRRMPNGMSDCLTIQKSSLMYGVFIHSFKNIFMYPTLYRSSR